MKKVVIIMAVVTGIMIGVIAFRTMNSSVAKFETALNEGRVNVSVDLYDLMEGEDRVEAREIAREYANTLYKEYFNEAEGRDYTVVSNELTKIYDNILYRDSEIEKLIDLADIINYSRTAYSAAEIYYEDGNYSDAISEYKKVVKEDTNYYKKAQEMIPQAINNLRIKVLTEADKYINESKLAEAKAEVKNGLTDIPDDSELQAKLHYIEKEITNRDISKVITEADEYIDNGRYMEAMDALEVAVNKYPGENTISARLETAQKGYKESSLENLSNYYETEDFSGALLELSIMKKYLPCDSEIDELIAKYESYMPVPLASLSTYEEMKVYSIGGAMKDNFGNTYLNSICLEAEQSAFYGSADCVGKLVYLVNGNYNRISGNLAYWGDAYESFHRGQSHLEIYSDGILVYTSTQITDSSKPFSFDVNIGDNCHELVIKLIPDNTFDSYVVLGDVKVFNR